MILKPGYKTTELLVTILSSVGAWLAEWQGSLSPKWAALATTISTAAYALSRAITKHGLAAATATTVATKPPLAVSTPVVPTPPAV